MSAQKDEPIITEIARNSGFEMLRKSILTGGSINRVYLLETSEGKKLIKLNSLSQFPGMFSAEKEGLNALRNTETFDIPEVFGAGNVKNCAYLLMAYRESAPKKAHFWEEFALQLSRLHQNTSENFGFPSSNYIGSLPQINGLEKTASKFYIEQRLKPQLETASKNGISFGDLSGFFQRISEAIPEEAPALIHGDLWNGNYLVNEQGLPCLIDAAVSYAPREMDLAMMQLFGGFPDKVFQIYDEIFPLAPNFSERLSLWQLYYLLVHLNIFGSSYLPQVKSIIKQFS